MIGPRDIVLVGMRAAGKTTLGRSLARLLDREFIDLDDVIERRAGRTVRAIFQGDGEPRFRELESAALRDLARKPSRGRRGSRSRGRVVATGGGIVMRAANRSLLRDLGTVVWLQANRATLRERLVRTRRPALLLRVRDGAPADPSLEVSALLRRRGPLYREVAKIVLRANGDSPGRLAARLVRRLAGERAIKT